MWFGQYVKDPVTGRHATDQLLWCAATPMAPDDAAVNAKAIEAIKGASGWLAVCIQCHAPSF